MNKGFNPAKYGMQVCSFCVGKGSIASPKRQCCPKCGGFGLIKKEDENLKRDMVREQ